MARLGRFMKRKEERRAGSAAPGSEKGLVVRATAQKEEGDRKGERKQKYKIVL